MGTDRCNRQVRYRAETYHQVKLYIFVVFFSKSCSELRAAAASVVTTTRQPRQVRLINGGDCLS